MNVSKGGKELTNWTITPLGVELGRVPVNYPILGPSMCIIFINDLPKNGENNSDYYGRPYYIYGRTEHNKKKIMQI